MEKAFTRCRLGRPWTEAITLLPEGRDLLIRPIRPEDAPRLRTAFSQLTTQDIRSRFLHAVTELTPEAAESLSTLNPAREFALIVAEPAPPGEAALGAVARAAIPDGLNEAEFSVIVGRPLRGHGLALHLMRKIIEWCRRKRLDAIYGDVLTDNTAMLELARSLGFKLHSSPDEPGVMKVRLTLKL